MKGRFFLNFTPDKLTTKSYRRSIMVFSISSNLNALDAFGKKLGVTANNVANHQSEGFKKSEANIFNVFFAKGAETFIC